MIRARRQPLVALGDGISHDRDDGRAERRAVRVDLVERVAGFVMYLTAAFRLDSEVERRPAFEHEVAVVYVEGQVFGQAAPLITLLALCSPLYLHRISCLALRARPRDGRLPAAGGLE